jgi:hypothetical protein
MVLIVRRKALRAAADAAPANDPANDGHGLASPSSASKD